MNSSIKRILTGVLCALAVLPAIFINMQVQKDFEYWPFQLTNFAIIIFAVRQIFLHKRVVTFNTNTMLYLFVYFFLGIAPLYQFACHATIWGGERLEGSDFFLTNLIIVIALLFYQYLYNVFYNKHAPKIRTCNTHRMLIRRHRIYPIFLSLISMGVTLYAFHSYPILLFLREFNDGDKIVFDAFDNTSMNLIYTIVIRPLPVLISAYYNMIYKRFDILACVLLVIALITNFPLSLPRFYVASVYLPLLMSYFPRLIKREYILKILFLFGVLYVFPFLNQGRTVTSINEIELSLNLNYEMFLEGHFDSFQNFTRVLTHNTVTYGRQLWGVLLFWFPRSLYADKPIGSGGYIAHEYNLDFDHISLNYWGEGWINFGIIGVFLFSFILAKINSKFDINFLSGKNNICRNMIYYIYLGLILFILRGDLISCFAYTVGMFISAYLTYKIFVKYEKVYL